MVKTNYTLHYAPAKWSVSDKSIFFIHGLWNDATIWGEWARQCADHGYQSWSINFPTGKTSLSINDYVAIVHDALDRIQSEYGVVPVLCGHSLGGLIAQVVASKRAIPAVVLIASVAPFGIRNIGWYWTAHLPRYTPQIFKHLFTRGVNRNLDECQLYREALTWVRGKLPPTIRQRWQDDLFDQLDGLQSLRQVDPPRIGRVLQSIILNTVRVPHIHSRQILIVAGKNDQVVPLRIQHSLVRKYAPDSTMIMHQFGHMVMRETGADHLLRRILHQLELVA
ncbi:MAG: alpha/beta hydrolase [Candidatus Kerfeldbacteria bacterium]|nr:alpha/beta hydrolase [Candidatus Kerfeldbacteria bacterium]